MGAGVVCVGVLAWLAALSAYDVRERRLPNHLTLPGAAVILALAALGGRGVPALAGAAALPLPCVVAPLAARGKGDGGVKTGGGLGGGARGGGFCCGGGARRAGPGRRPVGGGAVHRVAGPAGPCGPAAAGAGRGRRWRIWRIVGFGPRSERQARPNRAGPPPGEDGTRVAMDHSW